MDTKSKNIKHSKGMKIAALVIAILMFFMSGSFASLFIRGFAHYNIFSNPADVTNTAAFRTQMNNYITHVIEMGASSEYQTFEEYLKSAEAEGYSQEYYNDAKQAAAAHDLLDASAIEVYVDAQNRYRYAITYKGVRYFFSYDGSPISFEEFNGYSFVNPDLVDEVLTAPEITDFNEMETATEVVVPDDEYEGDVAYYDPYASGGWPQYIGEITDALARLNAIGEYTCYGELSKEEILEQIESQRLQYLEDRFYYGGIYSYSAGIVNSISNVNYAIIYKNSESVYTNCGVTAADSHEQIMQKLGSTTWAECLKGGKYQLLIGEENKESNSVYATFHTGMFGTYYTQSSLKNEYFGANHEDIAAAYFAVPDEQNGIDAFTVLNSSFEDYGEGLSLTTLLVLTVICLIAACAACIYLLSAAGKTADGIKISFLDKIPFEINWALGLCVMAAMAAAVVVIVAYEFMPLDLAANNDAEFVYAIMMALSKSTSELAGLCVAVFFMIWTGLNASLLRNIRNKTFFKYSIIFFILKPLGWLWKKFKNWVKRTVGKIRYVVDCDYSKGQGKKFKLLASTAVIAFVLATAIYYCIAGVFMFTGDEFLGFLLWVIGILGDAAIVMFVIVLITSQDRIMSAVSDMRKGKLNRRIDMKYMPPFMSRFAEDVLYMQEGLQNAVDSAVKDQRMKAELITNVSHDLKTPLTSIVNYVDLLKKCEIEDETAQRYVSILDEKSQRMKKLIEDLVEASKASSGAMEIHPVKLNLCEFAAQAVGEHEDELKKYGIELVLKVPEAPVMVIADAQKASRVVENLFSNIRKYALEGTRVYIDVAAGTEYGSVIFKNISKHPLDISPDELTQRFVRGDASRSGEGSGLGLSIAKDLCELQNGRLGLQIDGDLFKAIVALPIAE